MSEKVKACEHSAPKSKRPPLKEWDTEDLERHILWVEKELEELRKELAKR